MSSDEPLQQHLEGPSFSTPFGATTHGCADKAECKYVLNEIEKWTLLNTDPVTDKVYRDHVTSSCALIWEAITSRCSRGIHAYLDLHPSVFVEVLSIAHLYMRDTVGAPTDGKAHVYDIFSGNASALHDACCLYPGCHCFNGQPLDKHDLLWNPGSTGNDKGVHGRYLPCGKGVNHFEQEVLINDCSRVLMTLLECFKYSVVQHSLAPKSLDEFTQITGFVPNTSSLSKAPAGLHVVLKEVSDASKFCDIKRGRHKEMIAVRCMEENEEGIGKVITHTRAVVTSLRLIAGYWGWSRLAKTAAQLSNNMSNIPPPKNRKDPPVDDGQRDFSIPPDYVMATTAMVAENASIRLKMEEDMRCKYPSNFSIPPDYVMATTAMVEENARTRLKMEEDKENHVPMDRASSKWNQHFAALETYSSEHGNCSPGKKTIIDGFALGAWVARQRTAYTASTLSSERTQQLERLGFAFVLYKKRRT